MTVADIRPLVSMASVSELPDIVAELEACKAIAWLRIGGAQPQGSSKNALRNQTAKQISAVLGVPESAVYDWARKHRIPSERYGRFVRFDLDEVRAALNSKRPERGTRKKPARNGHLSGSPTASLPGGMQ